MILHEEQMKEAKVGLEVTPPVKSKGKCVKSTNSKKVKRFCPYGAQTSSQHSEDSTQLVETPIRVAKKSY